MTLKGIQIVIISIWISTLYNSILS